MWKKAALIVGLGALALMGAIVASSAPPCGRPVRAEVCDRLVDCPGKLTPTAASGRFVLFGCQPPAAAPRRLIAD